jgi:hypothetical protein
MTDEDLIQRMLDLLEATYNVKDNGQGTLEITINGNEHPTSLKRSMEAAWLIPQAKDRVGEGSRA